MADEVPEDKSPSARPPNGPLGMTRKILHRFEVDRATLYAVSLRIWQLGAGGITALLIAAFFSREMQGYHFTFGGLIALQTFFELGLAVVVVNITSHEWARLKLTSDGTIEGSDEARSRLISLGRMLFRWYGTASAGFMILVGAGGAWFLAERQSEIAWQGPWWTLTVLSSALLWTLPFNAMLEGCNQVAEVHRMRIQQAVLGNLTTWIVVASGGGLWAAVFSAGIRLAIELWFLLVRYQKFFSAFRSQPRGPIVGWKDELWPLQWRLGLQAVAGYFAFSIFSPVMFHHHGPVVAGQMGMTWVLITALQAAAIAWVQTRAPRFGVLISRHEYSELDHLFRRLTAISTIMICCGGAAICVMVVVFNRTDFVLADRILSLRPIAIFVVASVIFHIPHCLDLYIRAHKRDPVTAVNVLGSALIGYGVWMLGERFGPEGAAWSYLLSIACVITPGYCLAYHRIRIERPAG